MKTILRFAASLVASALLAGCGAGTFASNPAPTPTPTPSPTPGPTITCPPPPVIAPLPTPPAPTPVAGNAFSASVRAGNVPVVAASVQLYAAGSTGNGSAATALLPTPLTSDANGLVQVPAQYTCPGAGSNLYLVSSGGHPGSGTGSGAASGSNGGLVFLSALGACNSIATGQQFAVDESTTVAAAYALAPFYTAGSAAAKVGASATNAVGITNAFGSAAELANPTTGTAPGATLPANVAYASAPMISLSNAVNACAVSSAACSTLFAAATPPGAAAPANTFDALANIVRHPANNVSGIQHAALASTAYGPSPAGKPTDYTMFLTISGGGMNSPSGVGVDSTGAVWAASYFYTAAKFTPAGVPVFPSGITANGLNNSYGLAIDASDNAWIPNEQPAYGTSIGSVSKLSPAGASLAGSNGFMAGGLDFPTSVAIDPNSNAWVVDNGTSYVTLLTANGTPLSGTNGFRSDLFAFPVVVVVDGNHYGWIGNQDRITGHNLTSVIRVAPDGSSFVNFDCCDNIAGLAVDQANNVWVANAYGNSVSLVTNTCTVASTGYTGSGDINHPNGLAVDGAGNVWIANYLAPYVSELAGTMGGVPGTPLSPATGYGADAALVHAYGIAVDASGNLWVSNFGSSTLTKFIGLAAPVRTPLSGVVQQP